MAWERVSGVYMIRHIGSDECYIGSSIDVYNRWLQHKFMLRRGKHSFILQGAWDLHGENSFEFSLLEPCDPMRLAEREQHYIDTLTPKYNSKRYVIGWILTDKARKGLSVKLKARHARMSGEDKEDLRQRISESNKRWAIEHPEEAKARAKNQGELHVNHKITEDLVWYIILSPKTQADLSKELNISQSLISGIINGTKWPHILRPEVTPELKIQREEEINKARPRGEAASWSALTEPDVIDIIKRYSVGGWGIIKELADEYGVNKSSIQQILERRSWVHVWSRPELAGIEIGNSKKRRFTEPEVIDIKKRLAAGWSQSEVARIYGVANQSINQIASGKAWSHVSIEGMDNEYLRIPKPEKPKKAPKQRKNARLDDAMARVIKQRLAAGEKQSAIADDLHVSRSLLSAIATGQAWSHVTLDGENVS
jgi:group I intron endonuclease